MTLKIKIADIVISDDQRALRPWQVDHLSTKMKDRGYNISYPITIDENNVLVDGGHRIAAALVAGLDEVPYLRKPSDVSIIRHSINCNEDGADTARFDVFDYAELCWHKAQDGWTGQQIAQELGWTEANVSYHKKIKDRLHPRAWNLARGLTKNDNLVEEDNDDVVNQKLTMVNWSERHFRAFLKHLPWEPGDRAVMQAQIQGIQDILARFNEKDKRFGQTKKTVTAKWVGQLAMKQAWRVKLAKHMRDNLVARVSIRHRIDLLKNIRNDVYGDKPSDTNFEKLDRAVMRLNEEALGVILYHDDALQHLPLLEDKSISLVITDPPYNVTENEWDMIGTDGKYLKFTQQWLEKVRPKLDDDYHLFIFCDASYQARIEKLLVEDDWPLVSRVVWWNRSLPSGRQAKKQFASTWQMIFHCGTHDLNWLPKWSDERFDVQNFAAPNANSKEGCWHPTPKPQALVELLVRIGSKPTDIVLDPFAGGGTTGAACAAIRQRRCILIEKHDQFCNAIEERLNIRREAENGRDTEDRNH